MKNYSIQDIPVPHGREAVYKNSAFNSLLFTFVTFFLALGCFLGAHAGGYRDHDVNLPSGVLNWIGLVIGIMAMIGAFHYNARLRSSNWLVRLRPDQMLVKFRSYLNDHFPENDPVVVAMSLSEIQWVRKTREKLISANCSEHNSKQISWHTYLDIKLKSSEDGESLKKVLTTERNRSAPRSPVDELKHKLFRARKDKAPDHEINHLKQALKNERSRQKKKMRGSGTKHHHYPVRMVDDNVLRVEWGGVKPGIKSVLVMLDGKLNIEPELKITTDDWMDVQKEELGDKILDLAERGKIMEAVSLVRQKYGYSLTRSKEFVEELLQG